MSRQQPDRLADRLAYGPKLLMSRETLAKTGLVQPGSLIRWTYRVKLPASRASDKEALAAARAAIESKFPQAGFAIRDWTDPAPSLRREADRFTQFINFVGLTALLLGRHRRSARHPKLHGQEARDHRHVPCLGAPTVSFSRLSHPGTSSDHCRHCPSASLLVRSRRPFSRPFMAMRCRSPCNGASPFAALDRIARRALTMVRSS